MAFGILVAGAAIAELEFVQDAGLLEELHRAVDGRDRDPRVDSGGARMELVHVGVVVGGLEHARDCAALSVMRSPLAS